MSTQKKKNKWIFKLVLLLLLAGGGWAFWQWNRGGPTRPPLNTVTVDRGNLEQTVVATGSLEPVMNVEVGSQISGIISELFVDFNSQVEKGQVIAKLETSTFEADVQEKQSELDSAEAALELAKVEAARLEQLRERDLISQAELDQARVKLLQAEAARRIRMHALDRAKTELARCTIYSPIDGMVISRNVDVGQTVAASMTAPVLFTIANDLREMQIHAHVPEADIGEIGDGQRVQFTVDAYRDTFHGEVIQVRNQPIIESHVVMYDTVIRVENPDGRLKPGMTATVTIITDEKEDVLRVRNTALRARLPDAIRPSDPELPENDSNGGTWRVVYRLRDRNPQGELEAVAVHTGMSDGVWSEVYEGLEEGDLLATGIDLDAQAESQRRGSLFGPEPAQF
ncbi:MAG: efflux RND transporter periplasmic adaptor subunit [Verrucomicrobia bacterium]|nr:efflux RND transporter periplasmic adaptor subunit [Verrucomicrobiota bacterium]MCH8514069.1 efflux RND transporter periplasmic adaptor subunit [Kiritimatiellia bacterium]